MVKALRSKYGRGGKLMPFRNVYNVVPMRPYARMKPYAMRKARFVGGRPELKFFDNAISFQSDATSEIPASGQLCTIAQGDGPQNREGRKVNIKSILFNGNATLIPAAAATTTGVVCMWIVQDTQCNGAAATVANDDTGIFTAAGANATLSVRCLANVDRFKILKKFTFTLAPHAGATTAYNNVVIPFSYYKKVDIPIQYDNVATTGAIGTIRSNNIFLVSGATPNIDDQCTISGTLRLRFTE